MTILAARRRRRGRQRVSLVRTLLLLAVVIPFLYPLAYLISTAVKFRDDFVASPNSLIPAGLDFSHLDAAWHRGGLGPAMLNSAIAVLIGVVVVVTISVPAAYWFYSYQGKVSTTLRVSLIATMSFPLIAMIIPLFVILNALNLSNNLAMLGVLYGTVNIPFGIFLVYAYLKTGLSRSVLEAASVDGAGSWRTFFQITVPLSTPAISTLAALAFVWTWGDLLMAVVLLQDPAKQTAMVAVSNLNGLRDSLDVQLNAAAALLALLPILPVFVFAQRALARGFAPQGDSG